MFQQFVMCNVIGENDVCNFREVILRICCTGKARSDTISIPHWRKVEQRRHCGIRENGIENS